MVDRVTLIGLVCCLYPYWTCLHLDHGISTGSGVCCLDRRHRRRSVFDRGRGRGRLYSLRRLLLLSDREVVGHHVLKNGPPFFFFFKVMCLRVTSGFRKELSVSRSKFGEDVES